MFEWICSIGLGWGLLVTSAMVIIGGMGLIIVVSFVIYWATEIWNVIPYRVTEPIEKVGRVTWVIFMVLVGLTVLSVVVMKVYSEICGL